MEVQIKNVLEGMAQEISDLVEKSVRSSHQQFYTGEEIESICTEYRPDRVIEKTRNRKSFVVTNQDRIIGYGSIKKNQIKGIYILPEYFHMGLGKMLLSHLEKVAIENDLEIVELFASVNAQKFYELYGYAVVHEIRDENGPAFFMKKKVR